MNKKVLQTLEYHKIISMLVEEADSPLGKESAGNLLPSSDRPQITMADRDLPRTDAPLQVGKACLSRPAGYPAQPAAARKGRHPWYGRAAEYQPLSGNRENGH